MIDRISDFIIKKRRWSYGTHIGSISISTNRWLDIPVNGDIDEIPGMFLSAYVSLIRSNHSNFRMLVPLITNPEYTSRRLIRGAFMDFTRSINIGQLQGVHMASGSTYYGIPGIIFDGDLNLLLMVTYTVKRNSTNDTFNVSRVNCLISPKVFEHQDRIMEKTIIKKIIPFCAEHILTPAEVALERNMFYSYTDTNIKVVIDDCSTFISSSSVPRPSSLTEDKIKNFLINNEEEFIEPV